MFKIKFPGTPLPKRLLRPFSSMGLYSINDKQLVMVSISDRTVTIMVILAIPILGMFIGMGLWVALHFRQPVYLYVALISITVGLLLYYFGRRMKPTKFVVFDRENGYVHFPKSLASSECIAPWDDWAGRVLEQPTYSGLVRFNLCLVHIPNRVMWNLSSSLDGIDRLLGEWSFLVQYMDKSSRLPDIPELKDYPNRTLGLGSLEMWNNKRQRTRLEEPYLEWLNELMADSELDVVNAQIEKKRGGEC